MWMNKEMNMFEQNDEISGIPLYGLNDLFCTPKVNFNTKMKSDTM